MWSVVAAHLASTAGCRYVMPKTSEPSRTRSVAWASAASAAVASSIGVIRAAGALAVAHEVVGDVDAVPARGLGVRGRPPATSAHGCARYGHTEKRMARTVGVTGRVRSGG